MPEYDIHVSPLPSITMAEAAPLVACKTTENCMLSGSSRTERGSSVQLWLGLSTGLFTVAAGPPSANRKKLSATSVGVWLVFWTTIGVVHPPGPPNVFVTFGRYCWPMAAYACRG